MNTMSNPAGVKIPLVNSHLFATVDEEDAEFISQFEWVAVPHGDSHYAVTFVQDDEGGTHSVYMHDMVLAMHGRLG
jgi:phosphatidylethanolamine-binding protein (PEBP) family uncharacterized protein